MKILIYVEHADGQLTGASAELVTLARRLADGTSGRVEALVIASNADAIAAQLNGVDTIVRASDPSFVHYTQPSHSAALEAAVAQRSPELVLFGYTSCGLDLAPHLAARTGFSYAGYCTQLTQANGGLSAECQIYGGKLKAEMALSVPAIVSVTPGAFREERFERRAADVVDIALPQPAIHHPVRFVSASGVDPDAIDITQIGKLVCVGRGIGEKDNIEEARELASTLGGELVSSRPLVDIGWMPKERQVGKSGRKVKPRLYLALGVSGAPEHLEGMGASDLIIAVNTDANAPIFQVAHFGAVADCLDLITALKSALGQQGA